jgi:hypothetical protein
MKSSDLIDKEFKWISPITGGETFGVVFKVIKDKYITYTRIESTKGNVYPLKECTFKINNEFIEVRIDE